MSSPGSPSGSSHAASASGSRTTGIRLWIGRIVSFGFVVTIVQLWRVEPSFCFSAAHRPANANSSSSGRWSQTGPLAALVGQPLVEPVGGDQAAPLAKRLGERGLLGERLGAGVDQRPPALLRPAARNEPPAQAAEVAAGVVAAANGEHRIGRRDVEPRLLVGDVDRLEDVEPRPQPRGVGVRRGCSGRTWN